MALKGARSRYSGSNVTVLAVFAVLAVTPPPLCRRGSRKCVLLGDCGFPVVEVQRLALLGDVDLIPFYFPSYFQCQNAPI